MGSLCVQSYRDNDRIAHRIGWILDDGQFYEALRSVEGTNAEDWPMSPPVQQLVQETIHRNAPPVLLGVGMSGTGHWSAAIESKAPASILFDIACRNGKPAQWLGSTYAVSPAVRMTMVDTHRLQFHQRREETLPAMSMEITLSIGRWEGSERSANQFSILPDSQPEDRVTHRWSYCVAEIR